MMGLLTTEELGRDFPGVRALHNVSLEISPGRVHVLAGENGAGKSTLVKLMTGLDRPSRGKILIAGHDPFQAPNLFAKVAYVPQELSLFPHMTVAENLLIPFTGKRIINATAMAKAAQPWLDRFGIEADALALVRRISVPDQQLLQVARSCRHSDTEIVILDEPTSSLTPVEVERVFSVVRDLVAEGRAVIFISHKMEEVFEIGDDYTVLRGGEMIETGRLDQTDTAAMVRAMSGVYLSTRQHLRPPKPENQSPLLQVDSLSGAMFDKVSFTLNAGEILGFAGLVGAGRSEVMQTIFGFRKAQSGQVKVAGVPWRLGDTVRSVNHGMLYLSEERKHHGIFARLSVRENIGLSILDLTRSPLGISRKREHKEVKKIQQDYAIQTNSLEKHIRLLSGGNQQKAIIGRAMAMRPKILIFDEPTKGIDVRTKAEIYRILHNLAAEGMGIILVSSEIEELMACATRVVAMHSGQVIDIFAPENGGRPRIISAIFGKETANA